MSGVGLYFGNLSVAEVYVGSTPVQEVYVGSEMVWSAVKEVVQITLGTGNEARDQLRDALTSRGLNYQTITRVPFDIKLVGSGSAQNLFYACSALRSVPDMDTSQVTDMSGMFNMCTSLPYVPDLDTSNVMSMSSMFASCRSLTRVPDMDTSQVTNMGLMFYGCDWLTSVPVMDTSNVTNMKNMFASCNALMNVPNMDTSQVTDMDQMFFNCGSLTDGNVRLIGRHSDVTTKNMITSSGLTREPFYEPLVKITLGTGYEARDQLRAALTERGLSYSTVTEIPFDIELVGGGSVASMFRAYKALTDVPDLDTSNVTDMGSMFSGCSSLTDVPDLDTSQVTTMNSMFYNCSALTHLPDLDTSSVTNMINMFSGCSSLTDVPDLDTSNVRNIIGMFENCASLTDGNVRLIGRHPSINITSMILGSGLTREPFYDTAGNPI